MSKEYEAPGNCLLTSNNKNNNNKQFIHYTIITIQIKDKENISINKLIKK
jgi:hypothetical protein